MKRLEDFNDAHSFTLKKQIESPTLNSIDRDFLQTLSTRPSLVSKRQETTGKNNSLIFFCKLSRYRIRNSIR